jgi:hypothetical protein
MTKNEMMEKYYINTPENNYKEAQKRIKEAMERGESYVYLPGKNCSNDFSWVAMEETISKLREDGFKIDEVWQPYEYWSVEWGYDE